MNSTMQFVVHCCLDGVMLFLFKYLSRFVVSRELNSYTSIETKVEFTQMDFGLWCLCIRFV